MKYSEINLLLSEEENAFSRDLAFSRAVTLGDAIFNELGKLLFLDSPNDYNHWIRQIQGMCNRLAKIKLKGNKILTPEQYMAAIFSGPLAVSEDDSQVDISTLDQLREWTQSEPKYMECTRFSVSNEQLVEPLREFYEKLAVALPTGSVNVRGLVEHLFREIGKEL